MGATLIQCGQGTTLGFQGRKAVPFWESSPGEVNLPLIFIY